MLDRFRLGRKSVKEKGIATAVIAAVIVVIVAVAEIGAYFLMGPEVKEGLQRVRIGNPWLLC